LKSILTKYVSLCSLIQYLRRLILCCESLIKILDWNEVYAIKNVTLELYTTIWYEFEAKTSFYFISFSYLGCQGYEWIDFDIKKPLL